MGEVEGKERRVAVDIYLKNREGQLFTKNTGISIEETHSIDSEVCPVQVSER